MATVKTFQMQTIDENTKEVLEILHPETESEIVTYIDEEPIISPIGGVSVGKTYPNGSVQQVLYDILHPYIEPIISLSASPEGGIREKGTTLNSIMLTANITKKSSSITKVEFLNEDVVINTENSPDSNGGTITYSYSENLSESTILRARVTDEKGSIIYSNDIEYTFLYPLYVGSLDGNISTPTADQIITMDKRIVEKSDQTYTYTIDSKRMCIACPPGWTLSKILDHNNFDVTASFTVQSLSITGLDGINQTYTVYISDVTTQNNFKIVFNI